MALNHLPDNLVSESKALNTDKMAIHAVPYKLMENFEVQINRHEHLEHASLVSDINWQDAEKLSDHYLMYRKDFIKWQMAALLRNYVERGPGTNQGASAHNKTNNRRYATSSFCTIMRRTKGLRV